MNSMQLAFAEKSLRQLCESETAAVRKLGSQVANKLLGRLADLRACTYVSELAAGNPREVNHVSPGRFTLDLADGNTLVFCANHPKNPILKTGGIDWSRVSRIKIIGIENDHDDL